MRLGKNQIAVLLHVGNKGGKGFAGTARPWTIADDYRYRTILDRLEALGLITRLDSGSVFLVLGSDKGFSRFRSDFEITEAGLEIGLSALDIVSSACHT